MRALIIVGIVIGALGVVALLIGFAGMLLSCYYSIPYDEWIRDVKDLEQAEQKKELRKRGRIKRWELRLKRWRGGRSKHGKR